MKQHFYEIITVTRLTDLVDNLSHTNHKIPRTYGLFSNIFDSFIERVSLRFVVFNATFNNISAISCRSVLVVEEARVPEEIYRP